MRKCKWECTFRNIPRILNTAADDMCRRARELPEPGRLVLTPVEVGAAGAPAVDLEAIY